MKNFLTLIIIISSFAQAQFYEIAYEVQPQIHFTDKALENLKQYYPDQKQREEFLESAKKFLLSFIVLSIMNHKVNQNTLIK